METVFESVANEIRAKIEKNSLENGRVEERIIELNTKKSAELEKRKIAIFEDDTTSYQKAQNEIDKINTQLAMIEEQMKIKRLKESISEDFVRSAISKIFAEQDRLTQEYKNALIEKLAEIESLTEPFIKQISAGNDVIAEYSEYSKYFNKEIGQNGNDTVYSEYEPKRYEKADYLMNFFNTHILVKNNYGLK